MGFCADAGAGAAVSLAYDRPTRAKRGVGRSRRVSADAEHSSIVDQGVGGCDYRGESGARSGGELGGDCGAESGGESASWSGCSAGCVAPWISSSLRRLVRV